MEYSMYLKKPSQKILFILIVIFTVADFFFKYLIFLHWFFKQSRLINIFRYTKFFLLKTILCFEREQHE